MGNNNVYKHKQFKHGHEVAEFLNKNNIEKEKIVCIYTSEHFHHLIYISQEI